MRRWPWLLTALAAVLALAIWVLGWSSLTAVHAIQVVEPDELIQVAPDAVTAAMDSAEGRPLLRVDTGDLEQVLEAQPWVADAAVIRDWPRTLRVSITERTPVAAVPDGAQVQLVDREGQLIVSVDAVPLGVPTVMAEAGDHERVKIALGVLVALPDGLRAEVLQLDARSPDDVRLRLAGDREVRWGSSARSAEKARVLAALLQQPAAEYDVSTPEVPTTRS